jgi:hypothetical protein
VGIYLSHDITPTQPQSDGVSRVLFLQQHVAKLKSLGVLVMVTVHSRYVCCDGMLKISVMCCKTK